MKSAAAVLRLVLPPGCAGQRLDQALSILLPQFSRSRLAQWVRDPQDVKPGNQMPSLKLTDSEVGRLVAYLETLK